MIKGSHHSEETKKRMSESHKGKRNYLYGKHLSEETKRKMSLAHIGKHLSEITRKKMSMARKGIPLSEERKRKISIANKGRISPNKGVSMSEKQKRKISIANKGEKGGNWKGGVTPKIEIIRKSLECRLWKKAVFDRDNYTCIWCGYKGKEIVADHIKSFALFPELRFVVENGRTLCNKCHRMTSNYGINVNSEKRS